MKGREDCIEMLEKAFTILTSAEAAASTDDKYQSFGSCIANKLRNYMPCTRNKVLHEISNRMFAADQGLFHVLHPVSTPAPESQISSPTTPSSLAGSVDVNFSDLMCLKMFKPKFNY
jgi:hypothetical protein